MNQFTPKLITVLREGYTKRAFLGDVGAGITVAIIAIPLAMALAIASGVTPERGLFTAIVAGILISALGGSRVQIGGPTGAFVVIVYGIIRKHGYDGLAIATLMAGVILMIMGAAQFGSMIKFIPYPVTTGFTAGIAVIIFSTQIKDFFGLKLDALPADVIETWRSCLASASTWNPGAVAISAGSLAVMILLSKFLPRVPGPIIAVILAAAAARILQLPVETIGTKFGGIPASLPSPALPAITAAKIRLLMPEAATIAMLCAIESLLSAVVADGMTGFRHRSNCELIAQGVANIGSALFGGIPATGAIARTTANVKMGGTSPVAGIVHGFTILLIMVVAAPLASLVPLACLSSILLIVAWNMAEIPRVIHLFKAPKSDIAVLLTTFALTILVDLTFAVGIGVVLAAFLFMKRMSEVTNISKITRDFSNEDEGIGGAAKSRRKIPRGVEVFEINGPLFFGVVERVKTELDRVRKSPPVFIIEMKNVTAIDASGIHALTQFHEKCRKTRTTVMFTGLHAQPLVAFRNSGLDELVGEDNLLANVEEALERAAGLKRMRNEKLP